MSASAIGWIVSLIFILILVCGFFVGFWRGLKKSTFNLIFCIIGALFTFFITPPITNAVMGIKIDGAPIRELIVNMLKDNQDIANLIANNPKLEVLFQNLPQAIGNTIVFILVTIVVEGILYIFFKIFAMIFLKKKDGEKKKRISGGIVGLVKTFIVALLIFMPFSSMIGVCSNLFKSENYFVETEQTTEAKSQGIIADNVPETVVTVVTGLEDNLLTKVCGLFGLDDAMFDYYSNFTVNNQKVYIRQEINNYYEVVDFTYQISNKKDIVYKNIDYDKLDKVVKKVEDGGLFKAVISQSVSDMIQNYEDYSFLKDNELLNDYADIITAIGYGLENTPGEKVYDYFVNDIDNAYIIFKTLGKSGILDEISALEESSFKNILNILVSQDNIDDFEVAVNHLFKVNMVQDGIVPISKELLKSLEDVEEVGVETEDWTEDDWTELSNDITAVCQDLSVVLDEVGLDVINDFTILLDKTKDYDINLILSKLGSLVDKLTNIDLLKTVENKSIFDTLLTKNDIVLPTEEVYYTNELGEKDNKQLTNYQELFEFISPSITKIKDSGMYDVLKNSQDAKTSITELAGIISKEGNESLLSEILLPLQQIKLTKSVIFDETLNTLENNVVKFSTLTTYEDWENDLEYISNLLIEMNKLTITVDSETISYLEYAIDGNVDAIIDDLSTDNVEKILKPILYAKSTEGLKTDLMSSIKTTLDSLTDPALSNITLTSATLVEGNTEDQVQEICNIFTGFVAINKIYTDGMTLKDLITTNKTLVGTFLNTMKVNAYRVGLMLKTEAGVFNGAFRNLVNKIKSDYSDALEYIEQEKGEGYLDESNYKNIDFTELMDIIAEYEASI